MTIDEAAIEAAQSGYRYYYRPGRELRPIPPGKDEFSDEWLYLRKLLFEPWFEVEHAITPTDATRLYDDHLWQGDELMDAVVDLFVAEGPEKARGMFEQALLEGVDTLPNAPEALIALFREVTKIPEWYSEKRGEQGRRRILVATTPASAMMGSFAVFDTVLNSDVSAATGATGRFKAEPTKRYVQTAKYFSAVLLADKVGPGTEAFNTAMRVRLIHGLARRGLDARWGQAHFDMFGDPMPNSSFCGFMESMMISVLVDHRYGRAISREDLDDVWHFLAYWTWLAGVTDYLLPRSSMEAMRNLDYLLARNGRPSEWRAELATALLTGLLGRRNKLGTNAIAFAVAMSGRALMGPEMTELFFSDTRWAGAPFETPGRILLALCAVAARVAAIRDRVPGIGVLRRIRRLSTPHYVIGAGQSIFESTARRVKISADFRYHDHSTSGGGIKNRGELVADPHDAPLARQ
ncbi:hypothetical protein BKG69_13090 [Mycobacteroides chelonae]|uniref:oxygenase MpaB family protein n=1 Tax=Mycobacteroides chelonae TaxID=1774 RepID=UPI0008A9B9A2|nr:oxygenase MpaB family protein [Mycobacteroides chelonae]OHT79322.1 hypothetical protein BKG69_13090 [Mycobacteroides chelonae]